MSKIEDFVKSLNGKPVLIFGLGRSGLSCANALKAAGANIVVGDDNVLSSRAKSRDLKISPLPAVGRDDIAGMETLDLPNDDLSRYAYLVLSPGISLTHPKPHDIVEKAIAANLDIIGDIELFSLIYPDIKTIGVTGTNGKSTTTALIHHILSECGIKAQLGGNIGTPVFELDLSDENQWLVLELSSFQIDLCPTFRPDIAVILNLTPDHLDRHGDMDHYAEVKERITELSNRSDYNIAIICSDDPHTQKIYERAKDLNLREVIEVSTLKTMIGGVYVAGDILFDETGDSPAEIGDLSLIPNLSGIHNYQNAACAYIAALKSGLEQGQIWQALKSFRGLNHRQYHVRTINGVDYINDSKATNAASSAVAISCRDNIYWIVGGRQKKTGLEGLEEFFVHIKHAFLIGESSDDFAAWLDNYGVEYSKCDELERAVNAAHIMAQENRGQPRGAGVVLLSPACASFDQFKSFEDRGDKFIEIVKGLDE